jgi:hypothetical protein
VLLVIQPCACEPAQTFALTRFKSPQRLLVGTDALSARVDATRLDLGEHERVSVESDQVDLAMTGTFVTSQWSEPEPVEMSHGQLLAETAQRAA